MGRGNDPQPLQKMRHLRSIEMPQPFFRNKKPQAPYLQTLVFSPHLSSSSDLRIVSCAKPSQVSLMTDFRQMHNLHAYSGGTVRDSHPVIYSPAGLSPHPQALKWNIYLRVYDTPFRCNCQSNPIAGFGENRAAYALRKPYRKKR